MAVLGSVERINRERIIGWVLEDSAPDRRHVVELCLRGRHVAAAPATVERPDLAKKLGQRRADLGFELVLPYGTPLEADQMAVRVIGCDATLDVAEAAMRPEGVLDFLAGATIGGWAWHTGRPTERVTVIVKHDGKPVASVVADGFRHDLFEAGIGDGAHGFTVDLAAVAGLDQAAAAKVEVVFGASGDPLFNLIRNRSALSQFGNRISG
jgi:spore maturation protein SpmB